MAIGDELAALFLRDLTRLAQQIPALGDQEAICTIAKPGFGSQTTVGNSLEAVQ